MNELYKQYLLLKSEHPRKYARDLATLLGVSEAELAWARVGVDAKALKTDFPALLNRLKAVGETKNITRNEYAVHEQVGVYDNIHIGPHAGLVLNPRALDQRIFLSKWSSAFFIKEQSSRGERSSIQIFDSVGDAVLKIYTTEHTQQTAWDELINEFSLPEAPALIVAPPEPVLVNNQFDSNAIEQEWRAMTDVHQFFQLLHRHNITRQQAFAAVKRDLAYRVDNSALTQILTQAHQDGNEIMIFVGNRGCTQIFTGLIEKVVAMEGWINVFNRHFTLHLMDTKITESWVTRKPTQDGMVTSLELFAEDGTQIAQLYGQRSEGTPEQTRWRQQIEGLMVEAMSA